MHEGFLVGKCHWWKSRAQFQRITKTSTSITAHFQGKMIHPTFTSGPNPKRVPWILETACQVCSLGCICLVYSSLQVDMGKNGLKGAGQALLARSFWRNKSALVRNIVSITVDVYPSISHPGTGSSPFSQPTKTQRYPISLQLSRKALA